MAALIWAIVGLLLILLEFAIPGFVIFFFGVGGLLNALLTALIPPLAASIPAQIALWIGTSTLSLFLLRRYARTWFRGSGVKDDTSVIGATATVTEAIGETEGRIRFRGTTWSAIAYGEVIEPGETVTILKQENLTFIVTKGDLIAGDGARRLK